MVNYVQKFAGNKVSIEVSDPDDISKLSTLYADGSEARVVNMNAGLYRLINGVWTYISGPDPGHDSDSLILIVNISLDGVTEVADKSYEEVLSAYSSGKLILFHHHQYGMSFAEYSDELFKARYLYLNKEGSGAVQRVIELAIIEQVMSPQAVGSIISPIPLLPLVSDGDDGKVVGVVGYDYKLVNP